MSRRSRWPRIRLSELTDFLVETKTCLPADAATPVSPGPVKRHTYSRPPFRYAGEYLGDTVDIGREIVWYEDVPFWGMTCHGGLLREFVSMRRPVFLFLRQALALLDPACPIRGARHLDRDGFVYVNHLTGDVRSFVGRDAVYWRDRLICFYDYIGGEIGAATAPGASLLTD